jgi:D-sedoheptulose 7-phosphate isomerase
MKEDKPISEVISSYLSEVGTILQQMPEDQIERIVHLIEEARTKGKQIFLFGNGGSAATASHIACDLAKGAIVPQKPAIRAFSLTDNMALISAWANDMCYEEVFARQLSNWVQPGDLVIAISGSGSSQNVLNGVGLAKSAGATTIGLTGFDGGKLKDMVDFCIVVSSHSMEQIEDIHLLLGHIITLCLRKTSPVEGA